MALNKRKKNNTIDDLAAIVARGFDAQEKRFVKNVAALDKRISDLDKRINRRFDSQEKKFNYRFDEQEKRFNYRFDEQEKIFTDRFDALDEKYNSIMNTLDRLTKLMEIYYHEYLSLGVKVDRHEEWIKKIAEKAGVELVID